MDALHKITQLEFGADLSLRLTFEDGSAKTFSLAPLVRKGGVYAPLAQASEFRAAKIAPDGRYVEWPNGVDLCADALYIDGIPAHDEISDAAGRSRERGV